MNHSQKNWIQLLSMAQLALNNMKVTVTGVLVFYTNYGRYPNLFNILRKSSQAVVALKDIKRLR